MTDTFLGIIKTQEPSDSECAMNSGSMVNNKRYLCIIFQDLNRIHDATILKDIKENLNKCRNISDLYRKVTDNHVYKKNVNSPQIDL